MIPEAFGSTWAAWFLPAALQAVVLALAVALLDRPLRARGLSHLLHGLWLLVPLRLALPPALVGSLTPPGGSSHAYLTPVASLIGAPAARWQAPLTALAACWFLGALVAAAAALRTQRRARRRLLDRSRPASRRARRRLQRCARRLGLRGAPRLVVTPDTRVPAVIGLVRPVVVLPERLAEELGPEALDHVLLHELAHVRRGDLWTDVLFLLAGVVYWPVPLVGHARRRARRARELCCDADVAATLGGGTRGYRRTLLTLALRPAPETGAGATLLESGREALERVRALERAPSRRPGARRLVAAALTATLLALLLPLDAVPRPVDPADAMRAEVEAALRGDSSLLLRNAVRGLQAVRDRGRTPTPTTTKD